MIEVKIDKNLNLGNNIPLKIIAGPCALENEYIALKMCETLKTITGKYGLGYIFKTSFDKANRQSIDSARGIGLEKSLRVFERIKNEYGVPIITDVHECWQCDVVSKYVDILQIPAMLSRQTDLIVSAAKTQKTINIKKGQFMSPRSLVGAIKKIESTGNKNILLTDRGSSFGYERLVVDFCGIHDMKKTQYPVILDVTHAIQNQTINGENQEYALPLAMAGTGVGIAGLFFEVHPSPLEALCDASNQISPVMFENIISSVVTIDNLIKGTN